LHLWPWKAFGSSITLSLVIALYVVPALIDDIVVITPFVALVTDLDSVVF
jgi:hypothetical protein